MINSKEKGIKQVALVVDDAIQGDRELVNAIGKYVGIVVTRMDNSPGLGLGDNVEEVFFNQVFLLLLNKTLKTEGFKVVLIPDMDIPLNQEMKNKGEPDYIPLISFVAFVLLIIPT